VNHHLLSSIWDQNIYNTIMRVIIGRLVVVVVVVFVVVVVVVVFVVVVVWTAE